MMTMFSILVWSLLMTVGELGAGWAVVVLALALAFALAALALFAIVVVHGVQFHELIVIEHATDAEQHQRAGTVHFVAQAIESVSGLDHTASSDFGSAMTLESFSSRRSNASFCARNSGSVLW